MKVVTGHTLNLDVASKPFRFTQEPMKKSKMKMPWIKAMMETATSQLVDDHFSPILGIEAMCVNFELPTLLVTNSAVKPWTSVKQFAGHLV